MLTTNLSVHRAFFIWESMAVVKIIREVTALDCDSIESDVFNKCANYKIHCICSCGKEVLKIPTMSNKDTWFMCRYCSANYNSVKYGYRSKRELRRIQKYGSIENYHKHLAEKSRLTKIKKYGDLEKARAIRMQKTRVTNLCKYGCECTFQSDKVKAKIRKTVSDRYNNGELVDNVSQIKCIRDKIHKTNLERYGSAEYLASSDKVEKSRETSMLKYNTDSPNSSDIVKQHKLESVYKKYGVCSVNQVKSVRDKIYATCMRKYGKYWNVYKYLYDGVKFDSSWELIYYVWLKHRGVEFTYHPSISFTYTNESNSVSRYEPDFIIDGKLYEIKGDHFFNANGQLINPYAKGKPLCLCKHKCMVDNGVIILKGADLLDAFNYFETLGVDITKYQIKRNNL